MLATVICHVQPVTTSHKYKLYSEVYTGSRGQKPYAPNVAIHVRLQDSTLGNTKLKTHSGHNKHAFIQVDMGCKKTSNRVATITSQSTTDDLQQSSNQYQQGCEVQLNIPGKQLRLWTAGNYRCSLGEQTVQTRCITSQSRSKYVVARPSRMYSHGILFTKICIHVSASVAMSQTTIENCIGGHVNVLSVYGKT